MATSSSCTHPLPEWNRERVRGAHKNLYKCKAHADAQVWAEELTPYGVITKLMIDVKAEELFEQYRPVHKGRRRLGISPRETDIHIFRYGSKWFTSEEAMLLYRETENERRRVTRAGYPYTKEGIETYKAMRADLDEQIRLKKEREEAERRERDRLRTENGLHPKAHTTVLGSRERAERIIRHNKRVNQVGMTAEQRLTLIKDLYSDEHNTMTDILIKTARILGVNLGK